MHCVYIYVYTHAHAHPYKYTCSHMYICIYLHVCTYLWMHCVHISLCQRSTDFSTQSNILKSQKTSKWLFLVENQAYHGLPHPQNAPKHVLKLLLPQPVFSKVTRLHGKHRVKNTQIWLNEGTTNYVRTGSLKEVLNAKIPHIWAPQGSRMANEVDWRSMDPYVGGKLWALWYGDSLPFLAA